MRGFNLSEWALKHKPLVLFMIIAIVVSGIVAFNKLGRSEDPNFNVPAMTMVVMWPGASAEQVQNQVINRIEQKMQELEHLDNVRSYSRQGYGAITLWMKGGSSKAELEESWYQARKKISDIRHAFPKGVLGPVYNDEYTDVYSVLYALHAPELTIAERNDAAESLKRRLQSVEGVNKVDILGNQSERIYVEISTRRLAALGIAPNTIIDALAHQNAFTPAGALETQNDRVFVRIDGELKSAGDVRNVRIPLGDKILRLSDIATVYTGSEDPQRFTIRRNGEEVLAIGVTMKRNGNILELGEALEERMKQIRTALPAGVEIEKYSDQPKIVEESVWEFERSFLEALVIVLGVSFLFLGWRSGVVVAVSVPLVLGMVAIVMLMMGWNLDRISLGALIIALGLLVDDAIIAVEMMVVKLEEGWDRFRAATYAYSSTAFPMLTGTLVTVAGFMPVGFAKSIAGEYAGGIFWIVGTALIASWIVAVLFTPYLGTLLLPSASVASDAHDIYGSPLYLRLRRVVAWSVRHRKWVLGSTLALFVSAGAGMTLVQQQFFPTASRSELLIELRLREGSSFEATQTEVKKLERILKSDNDIEGFSAYTGSGTPRFYLSLSPELPSPAYAQFVVNTHDLSSRERVRERLMALSEKNSVFPECRVRVLRLEFGPPVGFPVQFRVIGPDRDTVREIAYRVRDAVRKSPLVRDTQLDWNEQVRSFSVHVDPDKARLAGLGREDIQNTLQTATNGVTITQIPRHEELVDVVMRSTTQERLSAAGLGDIVLFSPAGATIPLSQVATIEPTFEEPVLWRRDRNMALSVRSDLAEGVQGPYATGRILPSLRPIIDSLPEGYRIEAGGAIEESDKSNRALFAVFPAMFALMLLILMMQLQRFSLMFMVFMTAPLGLIGVVPALLIFNAPFGFVALLGVIALGGMIMRNSLILVDQIEQDIERGINGWEAIIGSTVRRARPVALTAAAAILAMIPLSGSVFWGPMAIAIMGGLCVATALTLVFVPALYAAWFNPAPPSGDAS